MTFLGHSLLSKDATVKICIAKSFFNHVNNVEIVPFLQHFIKQFFKSNSTYVLCSAVNFPLKIKGEKKEEALKIINL